MAELKIQFADCTLDLAARQLVRGGDDAHLPPKAFELLKLLIENRPRVLSKTELIERVWPGVFVSDASLAKVVSRIRKAIGQRDDSGIIRTVHGCGYSFAAELDDSKKSLTLTLAGQWETGNAVAGSLAEIVRFGYDDRYFDGYASRITGLSLDQVQAAARSTVDSDHLVWVVVGDRAKIEPGPRELKLGDLRVIDADGNVLPQ